MRVLVVDVGGSHVKLQLTGQEEVEKFDSGKGLTPRRMMKEVLRRAQERGWTFDAMTIGVPSPVVHGRVALEPANLGRGWTRFDFASAAPGPVRLVNDAAMQALGSYGGEGIMLFLGLGTGLGAALVAHGVLVPLELARLPWKRGELEDYVGERGLVRLGKARWRKGVAEVVEVLAAAFVADENRAGRGQRPQAEDAASGLAARLERLCHGGRGAPLGGAHPCCFTARERSPSARARAFPRIGTAGRSPAGSSVPITCTPAAPRLTEPATSPDSSSARRSPRSWPLPSPSVASTRAGRSGATSTTAHRWPGAKVSRPEPSRLAVSSQSWPRAATFTRSSPGSFPAESSTSARSSKSRPGRGGASRWTVPCTR